MAARTSTMNASGNASGNGSGRGAKGAGRPGLLPSGTGAFFRQRAIEALGLLVALCGVALIAACFTFRLSDPSLNRATDGAVQNLLGTPGAYVADFLLQSLGLAAFLLPLALITWGWRLVRRHGLPQWWLKFCALPAALLLLSLATSWLPLPASWPFPSLGLGGAVSHLLWAQIGPLGAAPWLVALVGALVGWPLLLYSFGFEGSEYRAAGRGLRWLLQVGTAWRSTAEAGEKPKARRKREKTAERREPRIEPEPDMAAPVDTAPLPDDEPEEAGLVAPKAPKAKPSRRAKQAAQRKLDFGPTGDYELPPLLLLAMPPDNARDAAVNRDSLEKNARLLESVLEDFGVKGEIVKVRPGPVVTRYELEPAPGIKTSRVVGLADDIARSMSAISVRVAVVPGSSVIGIELPNTRRETVFLRELLGSQAYERVGGKLPLILGKDIGGAPMIVDLARMPHLLIAGTTGSGKSVSINALILSLLYRLTPDSCKFIMIDPKMLELSVYEGIPHLLAPVVTEPKKAVVALKWIVREMEDRYRAMSRLGVRNIDGYNTRIGEARRSGEVLTRRVQTGFDPDTGQPVYEDQPFDLEPLPFIVVVVDEMADLMLVAGKDIEAAVQRLAQMARAAGIHLIMATQRPSVDVITGTIKANFPTRVSFHVTSKIDSRTILGEMGAEQLLGQGDMLYMAHGGRITRVHGPLVTDEEVEEVVGYLKKQGQPSYIEAVTEEEETEFGGEVAGSGDELYDKAIAIVCQHRKASTSFVQRQLQIGYNRAARIIERMEADGVVSPANHVGKREVLIQGSGDL